MTNARRKGASGEGEFAAAVLDVLGAHLARQLDQHRTDGLDLAPEPVSASDVAMLLRRYAIECKRPRSAPPAEVVGWWHQTVRQATDAGLHPLLAYRADRIPWRIVLPLELLVPDATGFSTAHDGSTAPHAATLTLAGFAAFAACTWPARS